MDEFTILAAKAAALRMKVAADDIADAGVGQADSPLGPAQHTLMTAANRPELPFARVNWERPVPFALSADRAQAAENPNAVPVRVPGKDNTSPIDPRSLLRHRVMRGLRNFGGNAARGFHNIWVRKRQQ